MKSIVRKLLALVYQFEDVVFRLWCKVNVTLQPLYVFSKKEKVPNGTKPLDSVPPLKDLYRKSHSKLCAFMPVAGTISYDYSIREARKYIFVSNWSHCCP